MKKLLLVVAVFALFALTAFSQIPKEINGGILNGKAVNLPKPDYPEGAKAAGLEGIVYVNVVIDEGGNVVSAIADDQPRKVTRPTKEGESYVEEQPVADILLRTAAEQAAWKAQFSPTLLNRVPVRVTGTIVYNFVASNGEEPQGEDPASTSRKPVTGGILNSKATSMPAPAYPPAGKAVEAEGVVNVQVTVDEEGNVISATAVSGHPLLRAASVKAAREAKFAPVLLSGQPVKFTGVLVYNFEATSEEN